MRYDVELIHGTYRTVVSVNMPDGSERELIIGKARARAKRDGFYCLPMAYERSTIIGTSEGDDDADR